MINMWKKKITTMLIVMNLILIRINNSYYMFNCLWTTIGGTALIACKTPTNVISSVSLPLTKASLNYICSGNDTDVITFVGVLHVIRAVPTIVVQIKLNT